MIGAEAPSAYHVAPRMDNPPGQPAGSPPVTATPASAGLAATTGKKKRGRPRKYGPDGSVTMTLSPMPLSSSAPPSGEFSSGKRGKARSGGSEFKQHKKVAMDHFSGDWNTSSLGTGFMPHMITVNAGEDVTMKVISFSQQGPRAICILSANGLISNVTLRQHDSSGGTLTYEGRFEILSLSGSFMPTETQGTRSRQGGMSVSLASPDGRVIGGGVAGLLIAASPVLVVVGSFLPSSHQEPKPKKHRAEQMPTTITPGISMVPPVSHAEKDGMSHGHGHPNSGAPRPNLASSAPFQRENWPAMNSMQDSRSSATDINISLPGG